MNEIDMIRAAAMVRRRHVAALGYIPPGTWPVSLDKRVQVLVKPVILCPGCGEQFTMEEIWVVWNSGDASRVLAVMALSIGLDYWKDVTAIWNHPHVDTGLRICMGNADDAAVALTAGINPESAYGGPEAVEKWFSQHLDHECDELARTYMCEDCEERFSQDNVTYLPGANRTVCDSCMESYSTCEKCGDETYYYDDDVVFHEGSIYCESHFDELFEDCNKCCETTAKEDLVEAIRFNYPGSRDYREIRVCPDCSENHFIECEECEDLTDVSHSSQGSVKEVTHFDKVKMMCTACRWDLADELKGDEDED